MWEVFSISLQKIACTPSRKVLFMLFDLKKSGTYKKLGKTA